MALDCHAKPAPGARRIIKIEFSLLLNNYIPSKRLKALK